MQVFFKTELYLWFMLGVQIVIYYVVSQNLSFNLCNVWLSMNRYLLLQQKYHSWLHHTTVYCQHLLFLGCPGNWEPVFLFIVFFLTSMSALYGMCTNSLIQGICTDKFQIILKPAKRKSNFAHGHDGYSLKWLTLATFSKVTLWPWCPNKFAPI